MPGKLRVLVIEDSERKYEHIRQTLSRTALNISTHRVETREAMQQALMNHDWDLILSNTDNPGFAPRESLKLLSDHQLDIPFLLVADHIGEEEVASLLKAGANDFINFNNLSRLAPAIERELKEAAVRREAERTKKALRHSENRYRQLVDHSPMPILLLQNNKIVYLNEAAKRSLAVSLERPLINKPANVLFIEDSKQLLDSLPSKPQM